MILFTRCYSKKEVCRDEDSALFSRNDNFIAQIQYVVYMKFPKCKGFVDTCLKRRCEKAIEYNLNPNF